MGFEDCIISARQQGGISPDEATELLDGFERYKRQYEARPETAPHARAKAKADLMKERQIAAAQKARATQLSAEAADNILHVAETYRTLSGAPDIQLAFSAVIDNKNNILAGTQSYTGQREAYVGEIHARMEEYLYKNRLKYFATGRKLDDAFEKNLRLEAHGVNTQDAEARAVYRSFAETAEFMRLEHKRFGGNIAHLENWGMPVAHNSIAVRRMGEETWVSRMIKDLDMLKMRDPLRKSGEFFQAGQEADFENSLRVAYKNIVTGGAINFENVGKSIAVGERRTDHRWMVFKDAEAAANYHAQLGQGTVFDTMMGHLHDMASDVAAIKVLGPDPETMVKWMMRVVDHEAAKINTGLPSLYNTRSEFLQTIRALVGKDPMAAKDHVAQDMRGNLATGSNYLERLWTVASGNVETVNPASAAIGVSVRSWLTATHLSGAVVSAALGDPFVQKVASGMAGIPALRGLGSLPAQLFKEMPAREITRAGIIFSDAMHRADLNLRRDGLLASSVEFTKGLVERSFKWTGLTPLTEGERRAAAQAFMFQAGDMLDYSLSEMEKAGRSTTGYGASPENFARHLRGFGFDEHKWELIRAVRGEDYGDAGRMLRPKDIHDFDPQDVVFRDLAFQYSEAIHAYMEEAVPQGTARTRTNLGGDVKRGGIADHVLGSAKMFLSYPVNMMMSMARATALETSEGAARGWGFASSAMLYLTIGGALQLQMLELRAGRDPKPVDDPAFWALAAARGGALGFYGDYLLADYKRGATDVAARFSGPVGGLISDGLSVLNPRAVLEDDEVNRGRQLAKLGQRYTPIQNTWFIKPLTERIIWDRLQLLADPAAYKTWQRKERQIMKEGQGMWWKRGEASPTRAPNFNTLAGD